MLPFQTREWLLIQYIQLHFDNSEENEKSAHNFCTKFEIFGYRDWSPKFETGLNFIIKSALYSIFWQDWFENCQNWFCELPLKLFETQDT